tara:strand:- start:189 stop:488 length:300 start_codon:yes stop_codon:yes gene_type:complete
MFNLSPINLSDCKPVNHLWPHMVEKLGPKPANNAVRQALDMQRMQGNSNTLPVLIMQTCGIALVSIDLIHQQTGFSCRDQGIILILSKKDKLIQLIRNT